jgi:hypothetical protein
LKFIAGGFYARAGGLDVVDGDAYVPETFVRVFVAVVGGVAVVGFGAVVVREFD